MLGLSQRAFHGHDPGVELGRGNRVGEGAAGKQAKAEHGHKAESLWGSTDGVGRARELEAGSLEATLGEAASSLTGPHETEGV